MSKAGRQVVWWLDPRGLPEAEDRACLEALGLEVVLPGSLEASTTGTPTALVLALEGQGSLAQQLEQYGLGQAASLLPLIVRVPPRNITAAVRVLDEGASHALAYDDFSRRAGRMRPPAFRPPRQGRPMSLWTLPAFGS